VSAFGGTIDKTSRSSDHIVLGMLGLAKIKFRQNFGKQGGKGGDFSSALFEKYYLDLAWRKATYFKWRVSLR